MALLSRKGIKEAYFELLLTISELQRGVFANEAKEVSSLLDVQIKSAQKSAKIDVENHRKQRAVFIYTPR